MGRVLDAGNMAFNESVISTVILWHFDSLLCADCPSNAFGILLISFKNGQWQGMNRRPEISIFEWILNVIKSRTDSSMVFYFIGRLFLIGHRKSSRWYICRSLWAPVSFLSILSVLMRNLHHFCFVSLWDSDDSFLVCHHGLPVCVDFGFEVTASCVSLAVRGE